MSYKRLDAKLNCDRGVKPDIDQVVKFVHLGGRQEEPGRSKRHIPRESGDGACGISFSEVIRSLV